MHARTHTLTKSFSSCFSLLCWLFVATGVLNCQNNKTHDMDFWPLIFLSQQQVSHMWRRFVVTVWAYQNNQNQCWTPVRTNLVNLQALTKGARELASNTLEDVTPHCAFTEGHNTRNAPSLCFSAEHASVSREVANLDSETNEDKTLWGVLDSFDTELHKERQEKTAGRCNAL